ncbi:hypothetical protein [uncultured Devosia sp.]|uniref:hypothetical protein n=1 Tax=uncultured Devosia sp. TaxID=211434 RepID=UPI002622AF96|nr:hypothetical protein [uncultured Devosia sp.]
MTDTSQPAKKPARSTSSKSRAKVKSAAQVGGQETVVLRQDVEGLGVAGQHVPMPPAKALELRQSGQARRLRYSDLQSRA